MDNVASIRTPERAALNTYPPRLGRPELPCDEMDYVFSEQGRPLRPMGNIEHSPRSARSHTTPEHDAIPLAASICMFIASTSLICTAPSSITLGICAVLGVIGTLFAGAAAGLSAYTARRAATCTLLVSSACAASEAVCIIAGTQSWEATVVAAACVIVILATVARAAIKGEKIADAEANLAQNVKHE